MDFLTVLIVSAALGIDAFSVAIGIGLTGVRKKGILLVTGIVTLFHILMPLLGLTLGTYLGQVAGPVAGTIGALVLIAIGLNTIRGGLRGLGSGAAERRGFVNVASPAGLIVMASSVSMDALTVGFGLGALQVDLFLTVVTMGIVAGLMTAAGLVFGRVLSKTVGEKAELLGGFILVAIGVKLLLG